MYAYVNVEVAMHRLLDAFEQAAAQALEEPGAGKYFSERQCDRLESLVQHIRAAIKEYKMGDAQ